MSVVQRHGEIWWHPKQVNWFLFQALKIGFIKIIYNTQNRLLIMLFKFCFLFRLHDCICSLIATFLSLL